MVETFLPRGAIAVVSRTALIAQVPERAALEAEKTMPIRRMPQIGPQQYAHIRLAWSKVNDADPGNAWLRNIVEDVARSFA